MSTSAKPPATEAAVAGQSMTVDESEVVSPIATGEVIDNKFRVDSIIGIGAIGLVVQATHLELNEEVAIKFLRPTKKDRRDQIVRFQREARAAARLKGEHVARVLDVGALPSGEPYMVMERLAGFDLEQQIESNGPILNLATAALYTIQACEALAEAHALGIIHRDIKPANLFLHSPAGALPIIKLLDFGISKAALTGEYTNIALSETKTTAIMGTPFYMAPEQVRSTKDVDQRADIWALGAVLYEILTAKTMWRSADLGALVQEILKDPPIPIQDKRPDIPDAFAQTLQGAFERDANLRYQNAAEFARALLPFAPATAVVHVERAERYVKNTVAQPIPTSLRTNKATNSSLDVVSSVDGAASSGQAPSTGSRVFGIAVGVSILMVLGAATAILAPRFMASPATSSGQGGGQSAPASATALSPPRPTSSTEILPVPPVTTTMATNPGVPPSHPLSSPANTNWPLRPVAPMTTGGGGGRPTPKASQDLPASAIATTGNIPIEPIPPMPTANPPPPTTTGGTKPKLDDNPWTKANKPKLDDLNK